MKNFSNFSRFLMRNDTVFLDSHEELKTEKNDRPSKNSMWIKISFFITERWTEREVMYVSYVGKLFLRMLKALILPLIVPSLVAAVGSLDMSISGKVNGNIFTVTQSQKFSQLWFLFPLLLRYIQCQPMQTVIFEMVIMPPKLHSIIKSS